MRRTRWIAAWVVVTGISMGALEVRAQVTIDGAGPFAVHESDSESTYLATVTASANVWVRLQVWHEGVRKHQTTTFVVTSGPTYAFSKLVTGMSSWGMDEDEVLDYRWKVWLAAQPWLSDTDDWYVTIGGYHSYLDTGRDHWMRQWA